MYRRRILCTLQFPLDLFLISFVIWGGAARAVRLSSFMHLSGPSRAPVWALKPPSWALVHKTTYAPKIYTSLCVMLLMQAASITWASGRGLGPGNLEFFGPQMALAYRLNAISQRPKNSRFPGPNPHLGSQIQLQKQKRRREKFSFPHISNKI